MHDGSRLSGHYHLTSKNGRLSKPSAAFDTAFNNLVVDLLTRLPIFVPEHQPQTTHHLGELDNGKSTSIMEDLSTSVTNNKPSPGSRDKYIAVYDNRNKSELESETTETTHNRTWTSWFSTVSNNWRKANSEDIVGQQGTTMGQSSIMIGGPQHRMTTINDGGPQHQLIGSSTGRNNNHTVVPQRREPIRPATDTGASLYVTPQQTFNPPAAAVARSTTTVTQPTNFLCTSTTGAQSADRLRNAYPPPNQGW